MAASTLTIAGATITRSTARLRLDRWTLALDRPCELEFTELGVSLPGSFAPESAVTLAIAGIGTVFSGWIFSRYEAGFTRGLPTVGYRCLDQKFAAYQFIPVTASDGTGTMSFNLPSTALNYQVSESGLSVGTILSQVFAQHSAILGAYGISTDATTATQLSALTAVPPDPIYVSGNRLWSQVDQLLQNWYGSKYAAVITGTGLIRVLDTTALSAQTLTFGTDPIYLDGLSEDTSECFTQVLLRGRDNVEPAYLSLHDATLVDPHTAAGDNLEASWTISDFLNPKGAYDIGAINSMSSTTLTVKSDNTLLTWAANYWSGLQAQIAAVNPTATGITGFEYRRIIANTALTAGGTSIITVDIPFANTGYTRYQIRGQNTTLSDVYRRLNIPNTWVAQHLVSQFNYAVPWSPQQGEVVQTWFPVGVVCGTSAGVPFQFPAQFEIIPYDGTHNGYIRFYQPWVSYFNAQSALATGGASITQATDIMVLVPYSRGTMSVSYPSSGYSGTAYSRLGITRTLTRDYSTWWDQGSTTAMGTLAQQIHDTVANVVQEGQVTYLGQLTAALTPGSPIALNLAHESLTTSYEAMAAPCRTVTLRWTQGGSGAFWETLLQFSTRRQMYSGDRLYVHTNYISGGFLSNQGFSGKVGVSGMPTGNVLEQAFENANMALGPEYNPVLSQTEQNAVNSAMGRESTALQNMTGAENQSALEASGQNTLNQMQRAEQQAQDRQFGRGVDPTAGF